MSRRFVDAPDDARCRWTITLRDGSAARCGRSHTNGQLCTQHAKMAAPAEDWMTPTTYLRRLGDALQALCGGRRPTDQMMTDWLDPDQDSLELQNFCADHGPFWGQGIGVIDAAMTLADQPTEGVEHEHRPTTIREGER